MSGEPERHLIRRFVLGGIAGVSFALVAIWLSASDRQPGGAVDATGASRKTSPVETSPQSGTGWPQWGGPNRDGIARGENLRKDWPEQGPTVLWEHATTGPGYSGLVVAGNRLYTLMQDGKTEAVVCWDAADGDELWRFRYPAEFVNEQGSGPRSTPTLDGGRLYTVGATGMLHCLNAATGEVVWRRDLVNEFGGRVPDWGVSFSPLIDGDRLLIHPGGAAGSSLAALDKRTGQLRWKSLDDRPAYSSPVISTAAGVKQVLFFTAEALVSVAPRDGRLYWRYPWTTTMDCNVATPITTGEQVFISSGYGHGCALLKVIAKDSGALAVEEVYTNKNMSNHFSTSALYQGHLYGFDDSLLVCMELESGQVKWRTRGFRKGSLIVADDHLIILGENGKLALAEATPAEYHEKASCRVSPYRCWTVPALAGGRLYVRDQHQIKCLDLNATQNESGRTTQGNRR